MRTSYAVEGSLTLATIADGSAGSLERISELISRARHNRRRPTPAALGWSRLPAALRHPRHRPHARRSPRILRPPRPHALRKFLRRQLVPSPAACASISSTSTPTAASPTIWATKSATPPPRSNFSISGSANSTPATNGTPKHPVFVALAETVRQFDIPKHEFSDLLIAFRQDQTVTRFETFNDVLAYCHYSANPVGHLVLYLCGYRDPERQQLSDFTCTALQLANFWQDVSVDYDKGRIYLPLEDLRRFNVTEDDIARKQNTPAFCAMMKFEVERARDWFRQGPSADRQSRSRTRHRSRSLQPRRSGNSQRDREARLRRPRKSSRQSPSRANSR